jgi:hypothetical protein
MLDDGLEVRVARAPAERLLEAIAGGIERRGITRASRRRLPADWRAHDT